MTVINYVVYIVNIFYISLVPTPDEALLAEHFVVVLG